MTFGETKGSGDAGEEGGCWPGPSAASRAPGRKEFLASLLPFRANSPNLGAGVPSHPANPWQTESLPTALIRQAKDREKGNAISLLLIAAFLYHRGHVGPSLSACVCRKQTGCAERDSSSFLSSPVPARGSGQLTSGTCCAGFRRSATGCSARLLEFHSCFSGGGIAFGCCCGDGLFLSSQQVWVLGCSQLFPAAARTAPWVRLNPPNPRFVLSSS